MDLIKEAKKSNKEAYISLIDKYSVIFYKVARVYFSFDLEIYDVLEKGASNAFKGIVNCKNEKDFLCLAIKEIVKISENKKNKKSNHSEDVAESLEKNAKYRMYKNDSIVEKCISNLEPNMKLPALLYFYVDLTNKEISDITGLSKNEIIKIINSTRNTISDIIDKEAV